MLDTLKIALCLKLCRHNLPDPSHDCLWVSYSHRAAMPRISSLESRARGTAFMSGGGGGALLSNFNVAFKSLWYGEGRGKTRSWYTGKIPATISFLRFSAECTWMKCWVHPLGVLFKGRQESKPQPAATDYCTFLLKWSPRHWEFFSRWSES